MFHHCRRRPDSTRLSQSVGYEPGGGEVTGPTLPAEAGTRTPDLRESGPT